MSNRHPDNQSHCSGSSQGSSRGPMHISRCVDCKKPLFSKTWKEKLKGHIKSTFLWPSKKRQEVPVGRYTVKQRCGDCQEPLRCSDCSDAFFENLSPEEIRVFIKAMVLFAMKGLCVDCSHGFKLVHHELFEDPCSSSSSPSASTGWETPYEKKSDSVVQERVTNPKLLDEIQSFEEISEGRGTHDLHSVLSGWKNGVVHGDWRREMSQVLGDRFHPMLER